MNFFFSSRRRHTRCLSDWSSDVCSSDLSPTGPRSRTGCASSWASRRWWWCGTRAKCGCGSEELKLHMCGIVRSEERRVGKECRGRVGADECKKRGGCGAREEVRECSLQR